MDVRLALAAVAQDAQTIGLDAQAANKIEPDAVGLARADDVAETERAGPQIEHGAVGRDQRFAGELACAVGGDRNQRTKILLRFVIPQIAIDAAAGGIEQTRRAGAAHGFDDLLRQKGAFAEVDVRLHGGARDVGIRRQVNHHVVAVHGAFERGQILHIAANHAQPAILLMMRVMPLAAAREVVVERDSFDAFVAQQPVGKVAADESGAAGDEKTLASSSRVSSDGLPFGGGALQQRMADQQMPEHRAQTFGVRCDAIGSERGNDDAFFGDLARESPVAPDDAEDVSARFGGRFERANDVDRHVLLAAAAAHREHQHAVARTDARALQPGGKAGVPAFVIGAGGQLRYVVGGRVGFKAAQFAKVVDRVAGVAGRPADAQDEQPAAQFANPRETRGHALDGGDVDAFENGNRFGDESCGEACRRSCRGRPESFLKPVRLVTCLNSVRRTNSWLLIG